MEVRDAVEADAERLAGMTDAPTDVMVNLVHDRTVRVGTEDETILGFVSFDARADTVHVTQLDGDPAAYDRLLEEPIRFAQSEGMAVELLVPEGEADLLGAVEGAEFEQVGSGPRFEGEPTRRYRLEVGAETH